VRVSVVICELTEQAKCFRKTSTHQTREIQEWYISEAVLGLSGARAESSQHLKLGDMAEPTVCETRWDKIISSFEGKHKELQEGHPDCSEELALLRTGLHTIGQLIHISPLANGNGAVWKELVAKAEAERAVLCKHLDGKALFTAMLRLYAALHREMRESDLPAQQKIDDEFREQSRRKRDAPEEQAKKSKTSVPTPESRNPRIRPQGEVAAKNFFAPLRTAEMEVESTLVEGTSDEPSSEPSSSKAGRPPPIVLTAAINLIKLQRLIRAILSSATPGAGPELSQRKWRISQRSGSILKATTSPTLPFSRNPRNLSRQ
jgi:hypothetical protein